MITLAERVAQLESRLADSKGFAERMRSDGRLVPKELQRAIAVTAADLSWLRELDSLRAITRGIFSGDHEAISRGLAAALEDELLLRVTHTLLARLAEKGRAL